MHAACDLILDIVVEKVASSDKCVGGNFSA